ncbi:rhox homeobox family member 1-like [Meriones unguiculatus]|uniref:rhox homeobox family member 1-like n=1 Tax=Meriones unguiculatus TaxID=10047 RepID=UPI00293E3590|nr:rhox homeobox family member 1-like [Meriones unguiculatus]
MARKYFYFDYDYYGVNFYEEEIMTEPEENVIYTAISSGFNRGEADTPNELSCEGYQNSLSDHNYQSRHTTKTWNTQQEKPEEAGDVVWTREQPSFKIPQKPYKFTPGQLWELQAVFEETQYPDSLRRKELAELMNVEEQKVQDWFNNKRAKLRRNQRKILKGINIPPTQDSLRMKTLVESKRIFILQEQVGDGFFW